MDENSVARRVIGAAIEVHRSIGPGLLESAYQSCLAREMDLLGLDYEKEATVAVEYKGERVQDAYRMDFLVEGKVVVELKVAAGIQGIHKAQLLTYLRLTGRRLGLLINFNEMLLKHGICRVVNDL